MAERSTQPGSRRTSVISDRDRRRAQDDRLVDDVRQDIARRVGGTYLPRVLSRQTITAIIVVLADNSHAGAVTADLDHEDLRYWVADLCDLDYDPRGNDRHYPFRREELKAIDYELEDAGLDADGDIVTDDPPLAETRLGNVPPTGGAD